MHLSEIISLERVDIFQVSPAFQDVVPGTSELGSKMDHDAYRLDYESN